MVMNPSLSFGKDNEAQRSQATCSRARVATACEQAQPRSPHATPNLILLWSLGHNGVLQVLWTPSSPGCLLIVPTCSIPPSKQLIPCLFSVEWSGHCVTSGVAKGFRGKTVGKGLGAEPGAQLSARIWSNCSVCKEDSGRQKP